MAESRNFHEHIAWFETLAKTDIARVGGKNASLGEMVQRLAGRGVRVPEGFAVTAAAYRAYVDANGIRNKLGARLSALQRGEAARRLFLDGELSAEVAQAIRDAYRELSRRSGVGEASVAVRSSATAEDLPDASFAGQQETFLNVRGERELLEGTRWTRQSLRHYESKVTPTGDPLGRTHYWFSVVPYESVDEGTDRWAFEHGYVSLTPLRLDLADDAALERVRKLEVWKKLRFE